MTSWPSAVDDKSAIYVRVHMHLSVSRRRIQLESVDTRILKWLAVGVQNLAGHRAQSGSRDDGNVLSPCQIWCCTLNWAEVFFFPNAAS